MQLTSFPYTTRNVRRLSVLHGSSTSLWPVPCSPVSLHTRYRTWTVPQATKDGAGSSLLKDVGVDLGNSLDCLLTETLLVMTVFVSIFVIAFCPNLPHDAQTWFLKPEERERLLSNLEESRGTETKGSAADSVPIWKVLIDWRVHLSTMCFVCCDFTASSIAAFAPTILTELGWTRTVAQLMTMPVWATGIVFTFSLTWLAARLNLRAPFLLLAISLQLVGWIIERVYVPHPGVRYSALFFMAAGTFPQMAILFSWLSANLRGRTYLAVGMAWMSGFGNCANFISSQVFFKREAPRYRTGVTTGLVFTVFGFVFVSAFAALLVWKNKKREAERARLSDDEKGSYDELYFMFVL